VFPRYTNRRSPSSEAITPSLYRRGARRRGSGRAL
jgi:hypothetical protein